ncbi:MAG: cobalamin biosynthesis protein [Ruminococcus sp.]|nr:cobalamin biosynthesis protein [Ruminococcus sp.]
MNIAVFSVTENGRQLSLRVAEALSAEHRVSRYCFHKHTDDNSAVFWNMGSMVGRLFERSDAFIFVCACGIAVRAAAPYLGSKPDDPAIIVMDDCGRFVIPVLSGHIGGANNLAETIAEALGSTAVITTSDDEAGGFSLERFAAANDLIIYNERAAKELTSAVRGDDKIGFFSSYRHGGMPEELTEFGVCRTGICIDKDASQKPFDITVNLVPKNIVLGIRCKSGASHELIKETVSDIIGNIDIRRVREAAVLSGQDENKALTECFSELGIPLKTVTAQELEGAAQQLSEPHSQCESIALMCSGGKLIISETGSEDISAAVCEAPVYIDFERQG